MTILLGQDERAWLTTGYQERYALGDPAQPIVTLNAADDAGCLWWADVPEGWDAPTVELPMDRRPQGNGGYSGRPSYEPRTLTVEGTVTAPTREALRAAHRRLLDAVLGGRGQFRRYTHLDDAPAKGLWVKPSGHPLWTWLDDRAADFAFTLQADDPIKTGDATLYGPVHLPDVTNEGGYLIDATESITAPVTATGANDAGVLLEVENDGDEDAHARYIVKGPVPDPLVVLGTGAVTGFRGYLSADDQLVIDTETGTIRVNGANRVDAWAPNATFPLIPPRGTEVRLTSRSGGRNPDATLHVLTAPAWR